METNRMKCFISKQYHLYMLILWMWCQSATERYDDTSRNIKCDNLSALLVVSGCVAHMVMSHIDCVYKNNGGCLSYFYIGLQIILNLHG